MPFLIKHSSYSFNPTILDWVEKWLLSKFQIEFNHKLLIFSLDVKEVTFKLQLIRIALLLVIINRFGQLLVLKSFLFLR